MTDPTTDSNRPSPWLLAGLAAVVVVFGVAVGLFARSGDDDGNAEPSTTSAAGEVEVEAEGDGRTPLGDFGEVAVTITDADGEVCEVCLLTATDDAQRQQGLMGVTDEDLGGYDGMLFEYPDEITGAFWMRDTPMPLSIAYFDGDREVVSTVDMEPCLDQGTSCPTYPADGPFRYALEVPQGGLAELLVADGSTFTIDARDCDEAA